MKSKILCIFLFALAISCTSDDKPITSSQYETVSIGDTVGDLKAKLGEPDSNQDYVDGMEVFTYVEKIYMGTRVVEEKVFLFYIKDGKVKSKKVESRRRAPYIEDSHDMEKTTDAAKKTENNVK